MTDADISEADWDAASRIRELEAENAELRANLHRSQTRVSRQWRTLISSLLVWLAVFCVLAAVPLVWFSVTLLDTDRYVDAVAPLAEDDAVREAAADVLADEILARVDVGGPLRLSLPEAFHGVIPVIENAFQQLVTDVSASSIESRAFSELWIEGNRRFHDSLVAEYLDWVRSAAWVAVLLAIGVFGTALLVSPHKLATLVWGAAAVAGGSAGTGALLAGARGAARGAAATEAGSRAIDKLFLALTRSLEVTVWVVFGLGLAVAVVGLIALLRRRSQSRSA